MKRLQIAAAGLALSIVACGSSVNTDSPGGSANSQSADVTTAQQSHQAADDSGNSVTVAAGHGAQAFMLLDTWVAERSVASLTDTLVIGGCTGQAQIQVLTGGLDANVTFDGNCTGKRQISGSIDIEASVDNGNRTLEVTEDLSYTLADKDVLQISSLDGELSTYEVDASGQPSDGNVVFSVTLNEHRVRNTADGNAVFDMNITTNANQVLVVQNSYANGGTHAPTQRTVQSGAVTVHHNRAKFTATHAFTNVVHDLTGSCACPQSGTIVQTVTADAGGSYTRTYTFTGCGSASVVTSESSLSNTANGSATITWNDCQN